MGQETTTTRDRIIGEAMRLFWEKGYLSTSIADILNAAEVNSGSLYHFFPSKQDLLLAVLETYRDGIHPMLLDPVWRDVDDPIERVFVLLAKYRELLEQTNCFYGCPIGSLALELHEPDPAVRKVLAENFSAWTAAIEECLERGTDRLPPDLDRTSLAAFVLTTMEGGVMLARTHRDLRWFDAGVDQLRDHFAALERRAAESNTKTRKGD